MTEFDVNNFDQFRIGLASAEKIRSWSYGEVKKPETINYRTLKPEKDGLFCEKIFGPTKDWECSCGKYKRIRFKDIVCERCGVEVTRAKVRRERMGHIELATPVSHIWYFKGSPSRLGYLLDISPKELEKVLYFASSIITWVDEEAREEDAEELKEELEASLEELDAERDRLIEAVRHQHIDYRDENGEREYDEDDLLSDEEVEEEIADLNDEFQERKELRQEAFDCFMKLYPKQLIQDEVLYREIRANYRDYFRGGMGAEAVRDLIDQMDLEAEAEVLRETIKTGKGQRRAKAIKRLKVVEAFLRSDNDPRDMILDVIPVIPPDIRPMVQLDGGRFATSDLNDLYRRVINRNNRLKKLLDQSAPDIIVNKSVRELYDMPMGTAFFAAASHIGNLLHFFNEIRLDIDEKMPYINSGVMLINLRQLRMEQNYKAVFDYINTHKGKLFLPDQDIISGLYGTRIIPLDSYRYNMTERLFAFHKQSGDKMDLDYVRNHTVIIHYCGRNKPWKAGYIGKLDRFYHETTARMEDHFSSANPE